MWKDEAINLATKKIFPTIKVNLLKGNYDKLLIYDIKSKLNYSQMEEAFKLLIKNKKYRMGYRPENISHLKKSELSYLVKNFKNELIWNFIQIKHFSNDINGFLLLKCDFERFFLLGDYPKSEQVIMKIEEMFGVSTWLVEMKFLLLEHVGGITDNKEYLDYINKTNPDVFVAFLAEFYSYKAEKTISAQQFQIRLKKIIDALNLEMISSYFSFKLNSKTSFNLEELHHILYLEGNSSIVDKYITTVKVCQLICSNKNEVIPHDLLNCINENILSLSEIIEDQLMYNLKFFFEPHTLSFIDNYVQKNMFMVADAYTLGKYNESFEISQKMLLEYPNCFELYEYYIKSSLYCNNNYETLKIINDFAKGLCKI